MDTLLNSYIIFDSQYYFWILLFTNIKKPIKPTTSKTIQDHPILQCRVFPFTTTWKDIPIASFHSVQIFQPEVAPVPFSFSTFQTVQSKKKEKKGMVKTEKQSTLLLDDFLIS